jgi:GNAT superfamily N-acetyltransferase
MLNLDRAVTVRLLCNAGLNRWQVLWSGYLSFYGADVPDDVTERTFERLRDEEQGMLGLVAVDPNDQAFGLAHLVFHASTWSASGYCYLEDLYIDPAHRGGPAAQASSTRSIARRERGVERVYWHTQQFNGPARSFMTTSVS